MTKIRRGGYVFYSWIGDHEPRHVHVHRADGAFVTRWDLETDRPIDGIPPGRLKDIIRELRCEGRL